MEWPKFYKKISIMKIVTDLNEINQLLESYNGANCQIVMYNNSLKRMAIRFKLPNQTPILYLVGIGCDYIEGNFEWKNAVVKLVNKNKLKNNDSVFEIRDELNNFRLITSGGVTLACGLEEEFGSSFDNFIQGDVTDSVSN
jgi:hypothetical protein